VLVTAARFHQCLGRQLQLKLQHHFGMFVASLRAPVQRHTLGHFKGRGGVDAVANATALTWKELLAENRETEGSFISEYLQSSRSCA